MSSSSSPFVITEHVVDGQHIREYPHATRTGDDALKLVLKRYTPKSNPNPQPGDLTIIGAHGSGFPKELYEPIWENVLSRLSQQGVRIRSIWIADIASQAASGQLNEECLGNDPSWFDHARDLLYMINQFKADMPRPIMGVGHSLGAGQLAILSAFHPRLFTSLVLIEPVILQDIITGKAHIFAHLSLARKDAWSSRAEAAAYFKKVFRRWDASVLDRWLEYGLRSVRSKKPGQSDYSSNNTAVTLSTSRHQEVMFYLRPNFLDKRLLNSETTDPDTQALNDPCFYPDIVGPAHAVYPFYRAELTIAWKLLRHIRPSVLYVFGGRSPVSTPDLRTDYLERTGTGVSGSGGHKYGRVQEVTVPGAGHHLPFEKVSQVSDATADWLRQETKRWAEEEARITNGWVELPVKERSSVSNEWHGHLRDCLDIYKREARPKL